MRLKNKVAIVTGAGQRDGDGVGNGRATAILFAREGARVLLVNRSMASMEGTRDLLRKDGVEADCMTGDVSKDDDCAAIMKNAVSMFGRVDILHNNVGTVGPDGDTTKIDRQTWDDTLSVNLTGAMQISKHVLPVMR